MSLPQIRLDATNPIGGDEPAADEPRGRIETSERGDVESPGHEPSREPSEFSVERTEAWKRGGSGRQDREEELARLVAEREKQLQDRELAYRDLLRDRELAVALSGKTLVGGAAVQLLKLWRDEFDVVEDSGACRIVSREGRTVGQAVDEWLARPEYAHFRPAASRGGAGAIVGHRVADAEVSRAAATLGESVVRRWREAADGGSGEGVAIGLNRRRPVW